MPENPLLPNAQLRALHSLLSQTLAEQKALPRAKRARSKSRPHPGFSPLLHREAILAGTLLQLCSGDILIPEPHDPLAGRLARKRAAETEGSAEEPASVLDLSHGSPQLTLAGALSHGLKHAGDRLSLVLTRSGLSEPAWQRTLASAEEEKLPLIVVCADPSGQDAFRQKSQPERPSPLNWTTLQRIAARHHLPVLSVDGEDAVAVYRVTQESILRARSGGGPAVIWAMLPTEVEAARRPKSNLPLRRLEHFLKTRQVAL